MDTSIGKRNREVQGSDDEQRPPKTGASSTSSDCSSEQFLVIKGIMLMLVRNLNDHKYCNSLSWSAFVVYLVRGRNGVATAEEDSGARPTMQHRVCRDHIRETIIDVTNRDAGVNKNNGNEKAAVLNQSLGRNSPTKPCRWIVSAPGRSEYCQNLRYSERICSWLVCTSCRTRRRTAVVQVPQCIRQKSLNHRFR